MCTNIIYFVITLQCSPVEQHPTYWVGDYGGVRGADEMKAEIYARGPIGCGIDVTSEFEQYTGGIFSQEKFLIMINHEVSVSCYINRTWRNFLPISLSILISDSFYHMNFLSCIKPCTKGTCTCTCMITFVTLAKICYTEYFYNKM